MIYRERNWKDTLQQVMDVLTIQIGVVKNIVKILIWIMPATCLMEKNFYSN